MKPQLALCSLAILGACVGSRRATPPPEPPATTVMVSTQPIVQREPVRSGAETLYAEYVMSTDGARHERLQLAGEVTCYGGPALDGNVPVELYVRRGVSDEQIVEDTVAIFPDDLIPRRMILSMTPGTGVSELHEGAELRGRVLLADDRGAQAVQIYEPVPGDLMLVARATTDENMTVIAHRLDPAIAASKGLALDELESPDDLARLQPAIFDIALAASLMTYKGDLPAIPSAECAEMFSFFPRPDGDATAAPEPHS